MTWRAVRNTLGRDLRLTHAIGGRIELGSYGVADDLWRSVQRGITSGALVLVDDGDTDPDAVAALALAAALNAHIEDVPATPDDPRADLEARVTILEERPGGGGGDGSGVTDHGQLTGLADDDHPQYLTPARADGRYATPAAVTAVTTALATTDAAVAGKATSTALNALADVVATKAAQSYVEYVEELALAGGGGGTGGPVTTDDVIGLAGYVDARANAIITVLTDLAPDALDTFAEVAAKLAAVDDTTGGLLTALAGKASSTDPRLTDARTPLAHAHPQTDVTGLTTALAGKVGTGDARLTDARAPTAHAHATTDVTGLDAALAGKQAAGDYATTTALTTGLAGKAPTSHTHTAVQVTDLTATVNTLIAAVVGAAPTTLDTIAEIDAAIGNDPNFATTMATALAGKAALSHVHALAEVTGLVTALAAKADAAATTTALAGKAPTVHAHTTTDVTGLTTALAGKADDAATTTALAGKVPTTRAVTAGTGLTGGGALSVDRALAADFGTGAGKVTQGNDARLTDARAPTAHAASHASAGSDPVTPAAIGAPTTAQLTAATLYHRAVAVLEVGQTVANLPGDFPAGGIVLRKMS